MENTVWLFCIVPSLITIEVDTTKRKFRTNGQSGYYKNRGTQREYSSKPLNWKSSDPKIIGIKTYLFENFSQKKGFRKF